MAMFDAYRGMVRQPGQMAPLRRFSPDVLESESVVPVVLEFEQPPVAVYKRLNPHEDAEKYEAQLAEAHQAFLKHLASLGLNVQMAFSNVTVAGPTGTTVVNMPHDFTTVFNGIGVLMPGRMVANVASQQGVRAVTLNRERVYLNLDQSVPFTGAPEIWGRTDTAGRSLKGEGVTIAVIDTGVDWTHEVFGGYTEAPNEKVIHAVSLTGEHPIDNFGHGTHVAAIIAADAEYKGTPRGDAQVNGVAPKAKILGYKVLTGAGSGSATNIILAMEDAARRGAHVMNLSLGDSFGDPYSPECSAANNAMLAGCIMVIAAGNAGPEASSVGAPGAAHHVITIVWTQ
jgi:subtilisin family serine protease